MTETRSKDDGKGLGITHNGRRYDAIINLESVNTKVGERYSDVKNIKSSRDKFDIL